MMKVLGTAQMQACDRSAIEEYRIPGVLLMENAGLQVLDAVLECFGDEPPASTAVVCGSGNNGGDGLVVARHLHNMGATVAVYLLGSGASCGGDAAVNYTIARQLGVEIFEPGGDVMIDLAAALSGYECIIDAVLGTGIESAARAPALAAIEAINATGATVVAIDLPSGVAADSGRVPGAAVAADVTVCLAALKPCHVLAPASDLCGDIELADISLPPQVLHQAVARFHWVTAVDVAAVLPPRPADSHKGSYGRVLVIGGVPGMAGAASLAARGVLRAGAGLVEVACPLAVHEIVSSVVPEALMLSLPCDAAGSFCAIARDLEGAMAAADVAVLGPGLGVGEPEGAFVRDLVAAFERPMVVDADALSAFAGAVDGIAGATGPRVLTPHPGEAARLLGLETAEVQADRPAAAAEIARRSGAIVVLKGHRTLIAAADEVTVVNGSGNPGMATGGAGDVLAGIIGALIAQGLAPFQAAWAGTWLHGVAGDAVAEELGERSTIAGDIADAIPIAFAAAEEWE